MLTATYSLVAISTEQNVMRRILHKLQRYVRETWEGMKSIDRNCIESVFSKLTQFDDYRRRRKVEVYLIPEIRRVTCEADVLLDELEGLSTAAVSLLRSVGAELISRTVEYSATRAHALLRSMDLYCHKLLRRLAREEEELFPIMQRVFSIDEWFGIAAKFLSEEERNREREQVRSPLPAAAFEKRPGRHINA